MTTHTVNRAARTTGPIPVIGSTGPDRNGFTFIELVIVLSIMTILVSITIPLVSKQVARQKIKSQKTDMNLIGESIEVFFNDTLAFPSGMADLLTDSGSFVQWAGPYYDTSLGASLFGGDASPEDDAWGNQYTFSVLSASSLRVSSPGPDQTANTGDDISVTVDVSFLRRFTTLDELDRINEAILEYNKVYLPGTPLPVNWTAILNTLISEGYLQSEGGAYATDGWGNPYEPVPASATPVVRVRSPMFL